MRHGFWRRAWVAIMVPSALVTFLAADWRAFRGTDNTGAAAPTNLPLTWRKADATADPGSAAAKAENIAWQADLPGRGVSGPIVVGDKLVVTCSSGIKQDRLHVILFDVNTGERAWERQFWATGHTSCHPTMAVAAPTPASDGKLIFASFSSNDVVCLDLDGNLQWFRGLTHDYPTAVNDVGMSASPVVVDGTLVVQVENKGESFVVGLDALTGETIWRHDRAQQMNWCSPAVLRGKDQDLVLVQSPTQLTAYEPKSGKEAWSYPTGCEIIPSVMAQDGIVFLPSSGLTALEPLDEGTPKLLWREG